MARKRMPPSKGPGRKAPKPVNEEQARAGMPYAHPGAGGGGKKGKRPSLAGMKHPGMYG